MQRLMQHLMSNKMIQLIKRLFSMFCYKTEKEWNASLLKAQRFIKFNGTIHTRNENNPVIVCNTGRAFYE